MTEKRRKIGPASNADKGGGEVSSAVHRWGAPRTQITKKGKKLSAKKKKKAGYGAPEGYESTTHHFPIKDPLVQQREYGQGRASLHLGGGERADRAHLADEEDHGKNVELNGDYPTVHKGFGIPSKPLLKGKKGSKNILGKAGGKKKSKETASSTQKRWKKN